MIYAPTFPLGHAELVQAFLDRWKGRATPRPVRVVRNRERGSKLDPRVVCVTRPGLFGNPFRVGRSYDLRRGLPDPVEVPAGEGLFVARVEDAVGLFALYLGACGGLHATARDVLGGKDLACFCPVFRCSCGWLGKLDDPFLAAPPPCPLCGNLSERCPCHADVLLATINP